MAFARVSIAAPHLWDVLPGLFVGAFVALAGWLRLGALLTVVTGWLRYRPGVRQVLPSPAAPREPNMPRASTA